MILISSGISLLALSAGMLLLAKTNAENLGKVYRLTSYFIIAVAILNLVSTGAKAMFHVYGKEHYKHEMKAHKKHKHKMHMHEGMRHHGMMHGGGMYGGGSCCVGGMGGCGMGQCGPAMTKGSCVMLNKSDAKDSCEIVCRAKEKTK